MILTSTVEENGRQYACEREMVTFTCQVIRSASLQWRSPLIRLISFTTDPTDPVSVPRPPFVATLTNIAGSGGNTNFTSTLQVTASRMFARINTTVECRNLLGVNRSSRFTVAGNLYTLYCSLILIGCLLFNQQNYENLEFIPFCKTLYPLSYQQFYINPAQVNALSSYARDNNTVECRNELGVTEESSITVAGI